MSPLVRFTRPLLAFIVELCLAASAAACPVRPPAGLTGTPVGEDLVVNGLPTAILLVTGKDRATAVIQQAQTAWREAGWDTRRSMAGEWLVVSAHSDRCVATLQLIERDGAYGYLAVSQPDRLRNPLEGAIKPLLVAGLDIESTTHSRDAGRAGTTALGSSDRGVTELRDDFLARLMQQGWKGVRSHRVRVPTENRDTERVTGQKGRQAFTAIIWREGRTRVVLTVGDAL